MTTDAAATAHATPGRDAEFRPWTCDELQHVVGLRFRLKEERGRAMVALAADGAYLELHGESTLLESDELLRDYEYAAPSWVAWHPCGVLVSPPGAGAA